MVVKEFIKMKRMMGLLFIIAGLMMWAPYPSSGMEISNEDIMKELKGLKDRINRLEKDVIRKDQEIEKLLKKKV